MSKSCLDPTVDAISNAGVGKTKQSFTVNLLTGWNAGVWIALGGMLATISWAKVPSTWGDFLFAAVFPLGLIGIIFMGGADLFTGDCMITPFACMTKKVKFNDQMRNWSLALGGNLIGSICWAWIVSLALLYGTNPALTTSAAYKAIIVANGKVGLAGGDYLGGFLTFMFKAIVCNFLVNFAIFQAFKSNDNLMAKVFNIWFPIMAFVAVGSEHLIANFFFIPVAIFTGAPILWQTAFLNNFLPVLLGNMIGGYVFMGLNYWFTTGCLTTDDAVGTNKGDATRIKLVLKQLIPLAVGFAILAIAYIIIPWGICSVLEAGTTTISGYARISLVTDPIMMNVMADLIIPIVIIIYTIGISVVLRLVFRKSKLLRA